MLPYICQMPYVLWHLNLKSINKLLSSIFSPQVYCLTSFCIICLGLLQSFYMGILFTSTLYQFLFPTIIYSPQVNWIIIKLNNWFESISSFHTVEDIQKLERYGHCGLNLGSTRGCQCLYNLIKERASECPYGTDIGDSRAKTHC